jgi:predicted lipoprotein with Yx(FWY)xxD motif
MRSKAIRIFLFTAAITSTIIVACSKDDDNPQTPKADIQIADNSTLGKIMTDSEGRTLYFFSLDASGSSACNDGCLDAWPVFYKADPTLGDPSLSAADFGVITRADGAKQSTYKGYPLYYYAQDAAAGDVNGEAVANVWFVAKTDYTVMLSNTQLVGNDGVEYTSQYVPGEEVTQYATDALGRTLYAFQPDKFNKNTYTKADLSNNPTWPIYEVTDIKSVPSILTKADFDTIHVFGKVQLTYKGRPLYYFGNDKQQRGSTKGVSVPAPGVWPIVNKNSTVAPQS